MSHFTLLIFNNEIQRKEAWRIAKARNIELQEGCYSVNPSIEVPHLFIDEPIISTASHYYDSGCRTLDDILSYEQKKIKNKKSKGGKYQRKKAQDIKMYSLYIENIRSRYIKWREFTEEITEKCGGLSVLSHESDHSNSEYVPILEEWKIKFADVTVETFVFLPKNILLKIVK